MYNWMTIPSYLGDFDNMLFPYDNYMLLYSNEEKFFTYIQESLFSTDYYI